jgi:hypothetical protein
MEPISCSSLTLLCTEAVTNTDLSASFVHKYPKQVRGTSHTPSEAMWSTWLLFLLAWHTQATDPLFLDTLYQTRQVQTVLEHQPVAERSCREPVVCQGLVTHEHPVYMGTFSLQVQ